MAVKRSNQRPARPRAATADVVGSNLQPHEHVPQKWKRYYERLMATRDYLLRQQSDQVRDATEEQPAYSFHMADAGTDSFDRDLALSRVSSEQDAVYEIEEALMRIRHGTYGVCELTGKPIERERLEAVPWARFSAAAEKQLEENGELHRTRLAPREAINRGVSGESEAEGSTADEAVQ